MFLYSKPQTVGRKIICAYLVIWCIPILLNANNHISTNKVIEKLRLTNTGQLELESRDASAAFKNESLAAPVARFIRQLSPTYKKESSSVEYLLDLLVARIITLTISFILGLFIVIFLISRIYQSLESISLAISNLSQGQLRQTVSIQGLKLKNAEIVAEELEKLRNRLVASEEHQLNFLRHVSHEIKTPLTSIKEGVQLLEDELQGPINDEQREITDILSSSTAELQTSIESLLNFNSALSMQQVPTTRNGELKRTNR